jgi:ribosomal protein L37AE/L43A
MQHSIYWIHCLDHTDIFTQGYVGISKSAEKRWIQHFKRSGNRHLNFAIEKYGWDNLVKEKIVIGGKDYCLDIEKKLRSADGIGWNLVAGGGIPPSAYGNKYGLGRPAWNKGKTSSEETRKKISDSVRLQMQDPARREINRRLLIGKPSLMRGKKHSAESILRMREAHKGPSKKKGVLLTKEQRQHLSDLVQQKPKWICPHCHKTGHQKGAANRWHFDNCRFIKETSWL